MNMLSDFDTGLLLNMQMLEDSLEDTYNILYFSHHQDPQKLSVAGAYYGQKELNPGCVYIACAETLDRYPIADPEICLITIGVPKHLAPDCSVIEVETDQPWEALLNRVQDIFYRYQSWVQKLFYILNNGGGLFELCVAAVDLFHNPLYIHDENFNVLAMPMWVVGMTKLDVDQASGNPIVPLGTVKKLGRNPDYRKTLLTHGAQMWNPPYNAHRVLYTNIWVQDKYCGRFLINELNDCFKPSDFLMSEFFVEILCIAFERNLFKSSSVSSFEKVLQQVLSGEKTVDHYFLNRLRMLGWQPEDSYLCLKIEPEDATDQLVAKRICSTLSTTLKKSFSFFTSTGVYTLINLQQTGYTQQDCERKLRTLCESFIGCAGLGNPFRDIHLLQESFRQAEKALRIGKSRDPMAVVYPFSQYVLDYILLHFTEEYSPEQIIAEPVLLLERMDQEKGTCYIETLRCFFDNCCQQTAAAQAMFIHRSTLDYRLKKIRELTNCDLTDPDTRLYLQISLRLLPLIQPPLDKKDNQ